MTADHPLVTAIADRFGGRLAQGFHEPDGLACALEAASVARGVDWTDAPEAVGLPDLRPLNDGPWESDAQRTEHMVPVMIALWDWADWSDDRRTAWAQRVAERTIREVLPVGLRAVGLDAAAARCEAEGTADAADAADAAAADADAAEAARAARAAAWAAWTAADAARAARAAADAAFDPSLTPADIGWLGDEAAVAASWAARAAADAARAAADAAAAEAADVLALACRIWTEEAA